MPNVKNTKDFGELYNQFEKEASSRSKMDKDMLLTLSGAGKQIWIAIFKRKRFVTYMLKVTSGMILYMALDHAWDMSDESIDKYLKVRGWE